VLSWFGSGGILLGNYTPGMSGTLHAFEATTRHCKVVGLLLFLPDGDATESDSGICAVGIIVLSFELQVRITTKRASLIRNCSE
jgi:hypothetical protein